MESEIINLLKKIDEDTNVIKPNNYLNVISFELPLGELNFIPESIEGDNKISPTIYNENKEMFENFKEILLSNYIDSANTEEFSEEVYVSIFKFKDIQKVIVEVHFN